jgi:hypothetical protein
MIFLRNSLVAKGLEIINDYWLKQIRKLPKDSGPWR